MFQLPTSEETIQIISRQKNAYRNPSGFDTNLYSNSQRSTCSTSNGATLNKRANLMSRKRIIIVDDDIHILRLLKLNAKKFCPYCEISVATNGSMALGYIQKHSPVKPFDLLVTGYNLPSMNGLDLAHTARHTWPNMRIVLMAHPNEFTAVKSNFRPLKLDGYMQKPLSMDTFQEMLQLA